MSDVFEKLKSKINYIKDLKKGGTVTDEIRETRMNICLSCERFDSTFGTCKECGCIVKGKTYLAHASCPINKWTIVEKSTD